MNHRVLELLKNPKNIQSEDLNLLKEEINSFPYIQNIRALHLYGVYLYDKENYQKELSTTAAYTTDKKILYQLINGKVQQKSKPEIGENKNILKTEKEQLGEGSSEFMNGERNRILFEGEENFLEEKNNQVNPSVKVDEVKNNFIPNNDSKVEVSNSKEGAQLISAEPEITNDLKSTEVTSEEITNEDQMTSEEIIMKVSEESELSFHGTDSFMPEVKIQPKTYDEFAKAEITRQKINKHEDEMRRLIEEVEKKMKTSKKPVSRKETDTEPVGHDINFAETQGFQVKEVLEEKRERKVEVIEENKIDQVGVVGESIEESASMTEASEQKNKEKSAWRPMSFESSVPDSLINKPKEIIQPKEEIIEEQAKEETLPAVEEESKISHLDITKEKEEEAPVFNVSFFSSDISNWTTEDQTRGEISENIEAKRSLEKEQVSPVDSNIPGFINTWQSWLKINRPDKEPEKAKAEIKSKAIESFIENNPKISQLKDESSFVVKEKNDDISHLMTETLANLYFEQKLYTKAIKAFEVLAHKHPEKKDYFENKIQEIKENRGKN